MSTGGGITIARAALLGWMHRVLQRKGMFAADAELVLSRLLEAEERGRAEGGVALLADIVHAMDAGDIDPRARTLTAVDAPAVAILDGSTGVGQVGATKAMQLALQKAATAGLALVVVRNSQPCGDVRLYAELAAQAGCIGFCTTNSGKACVHAGAQPVWALQPQAWAIPTEQGALVAVQTTAGAEPTAVDGLSGVVRGLVSLALTAGVCGTRAPAAKKKASPYGAGAEHCCVAVHLPTLQGAESVAKLAGETAELIGESVAPWERVAWGSPSETIALAPATCAALQELGTEQRLPFPE